MIPIRQTLPMVKSEPIPGSMGPHASGPAERNVATRGGPQFQHSGIELVPQLSYRHYMSTLPSVVLLLSWDSHKKDPAFSIIVTHGTPTASKRPNEGVKGGRATLPLGFAPRGGIGRGAATRPAVEQACLPYHLRNCGIAASRAKFGGHVADPKNSPSQTGLDRRI